MEEEERRYYFVATFCILCSGYYSFRDFSAMNFYNINHLVLQNAAACRSNYYAYFVSLIAFLSRAQSFTSLMADLDQDIN